MITNPGKFQVIMLSKDALMLHITHKLRSYDNKLVKSLRIENDYQIKFNEHLSMLCSTKAIH